jgi:hypothetical protein
MNHTNLQNEPQNIKQTLKTVDWIGLKPSDKSVSREKLIPLTQRDQQKARKLLERTDIPTALR